MNGPIGPAIDSADENGWNKDETWVVDAKSSGACGDDAVGNYYQSHYWKKGRVDDEDVFLVVECNYFVEQYDNDGDRAEDDPHRFGCEVQNGFIICRDKDDPGGTEIWSDYTYESADARFFETIEDAEGVCSRRALEDERYGLFWDGETIPRLR